MHSCHILSASMTEQNHIHGTTHVPPPDPHISHSWNAWMTASGFGFCGGVLPSFIRLATLLSAAGLAAGDFDPPHFTYYLAMLMYGLIGGTVSAALKQFTSREAFIAGIVAPS